jgi:ectoine hydroxylase-related dioxygenase (phytanoyl-CoA dioxygenase family)
MAISEEHFAHLLKHGYVLVPNFLKPVELRSAQAGMGRYFPSADELAKTPHRYGWVFDDPENLQIEFPYADDTLNHITTHPAILALSKRLIGVEDVMLSQAAIWAKYAGTGSFEQTMHLDYEGNTLVVPRDDGPYRQVNLILYYSDVTDQMGPTYVVSQTKTKKAGLWPPFRPRDSYRALYKDQVPMVASAGSLLIFTMSTFHRAGEILAEHGARFSHHLVYRSAQCTFNGHHQYSQFGEKPEMQRFIQRATPEQRQAVGFPAPGHEYWTPETVAAVAQRYPKLDLAPYRANAGYRTVREA